MTNTFLADRWVCVFGDLWPPARVTEHIETTRELDGIQEDSWTFDSYSELPPCSATSCDLNARWTFHPDDGPTLTIWTDTPRAFRYRGDVIGQCERGPSSRGPLTPKRQ
jgi:hypothetical protein